MLDFPECVFWDWIFTATPQKNTLLDCFDHIDPIQKIISLPGNDNDYVNDNANYDDNVNDDDNDDDNDSNDDDNNSFGVDSIHFIEYIKKLSEQRGDVNKWICNLYMMIMLLMK